MNPEKDVQRVGACVFFQISVSSGVFLGWMEVRYRPETRPQICFKYVPLVTRSQDSNTLDRLKFLQVFFLRPFRQFAVTSTDIPGSSSPVGRLQQAAASDGCRQLLTEFCVAALLEP